MNTELLFRKATPSDVVRIVEIIAHAKAQMKARGSTQWQDGYPATEDIERDIESGCGWILSHSATPPIAYGAVVFDGERAYKALEGEWIADLPYVVVHRLAVADGEKGRGIATEFMLRVEALARQKGVGSFRIDTNFDNDYMLRMVARLGFSGCGKIYYDGGERLAFEKLLQ